MEQREDLLLHIRPLLATRAFLYDLLRCAFLREPSDEFLAGIGAVIAEGEIPFVRENDAIAKGVEQIAGYLSQNGINAITCDKLRGEYTRLFIGPGELPAPLWESAYCGEERLLFQKETLEVRKCYLKYSFLPVGYGVEADDHLGLELDFMYRLTEMALTELDHHNWQLLQQIFNDQRQFLEEHLLKWVPSLCNDIAETAQTGFYQGIASLLKGVLAVDEKALNELLDLGNH